MESPISNGLHSRMIKSRAWIPYFVLGLSLLLTFSATYYLYSITKAKEHLRFNNIINRNQKSIENRLEMYIAILRAGKGLFNASEYVNRSEFKTFIEGIQVQKNYPGIQGVGFSKWVQPSQKNALIADMRKEYHHFDIRPGGDRSEYTAIIYLEPQDVRNQVAIGFDMFAEKVRHEAMVRAIESGLPSMSGRVTLVQEIDVKKQAGFLMYVPVYSRGKPLSTVQDRWAAIYGFVYSPFRVNDLMGGILGSGKTPELDFQIFVGEESRRDNMLYNSNPERDSKRYQPRYTDTRFLEIGGLRWSIVFNTLPQFDTLSQRNQITFTWFIGLLISFILFAVTLSLSRAQARSEKFANELLKSQQELKEAERLKGEFLANVSHELRTPLTLTLAPLESLLSREYGTVTDQQKPILEVIHNNAVRLLQMITGLLDFSKLDAGKIEVKREATPIVSLTRTILLDFQPLMQSKLLKLEQNLCSETVVDMDRYLYERVLFNLLSNAVKFTPNGGKISVKLNWVQDRLKLQVSDSGVGIPEKEIPNLFQRFRQIEGSSTRRFEGTGLGLAIVKEFTELLGGVVSVQSVLGKGSTFSIEYLAPKSNFNVTATSLQRKSINLQKYGGISTPDKEAVQTSKQWDRLPKILVAEDNPELASYIVSLLKNISHLRIAQDGEEALELVQEWAPDIIISDIMMPRRDGLSLCREIKKNLKTAKTPVVLLTALTHREALLKGWESGADEYLFKPFHPKELTMRIKALISNVQMREEVEKIKLTTQKMAAIGQLAGGIAHEINNPLGVISGFAQSMCKKVEKNDPFFIPVQSIERETNRCRMLIQDLLTFSRTTKADREECSLSEVIHRAARLVESQSKVKSVEIVKEIHVNSMKMWIDQNQIEQVIINLCSNAIDAMPNGGKLKISAKDVVKEGQSYLEMAVSDNGDGIPEEIQNRIFEPFFTTKEVGKGTGLGLSLVHEIVRNHDGTIEVQSVVGKGTTFRILLPTKQALLTTKV